MDKKEWKKFITNQKIGTWINGLKEGAWQSFDENGKLTEIVEKPTDPPSNIAIGGIYLYDERFWDILDEVSATDSDGFSISDLNRKYIAMGDVHLKDLGDQEWLDCGTPDALLRAAELAKDGLLSPEPCNIRPGDPNPMGSQ